MVQSTPLTQRVFTDGNSPIANNRKQASSPSSVQHAIDRKSIDTKNLSAVAGIAGFVIAKTSKTSHRKQRHIPHQSPVHTNHESDAFRCVDGFLRRQKNPRFSGFQSDARNFKKSESIGKRYDPTTID
jgi:hypothetical protein